MIIAGILAIVVPPAAGIAVAILVGWLLVFSGGAHLAFAWRTRGTGGFLWEVLLGILYIAVGAYLLLHPVAGLASLTLALAISVRGRNVGIGPVPSFAPDARVRLDPGRQHHYSNPCGYDLENLALEHGMGNWHARRRQHAF